MTRFEVRLSLAEGFYKIGWHDDALEELEKLPPIARAHPDVLLLHLDILLAMGRWKDAVELGTECCRVWSTHAGFLWQTSEALMRLECPRRALTLLESASGSLDELPEYHFAIAWCASRLGLIDDAEDAIQECFRRDAAYPRKRFNDSNSKFLRDRFDARQTIKTTVWK